MSKGSTYRPFDYDKFSENFERIFGPCDSDEVVAASKDIWHQDSPRIKTKEDVELDLALSDYINNN